MCTVVAKVTGCDHSPTGYIGYSSTSEVELFAGAAPEIHGNFFVVNNSTPSHHRVD